MSLTSKILLHHYKYLKTMNHIIYLDIIMYFWQKLCEFPCLKFPYKLYTGPKSLKECRYCTNFVFLTSVVDELVTRNRTTPLLYQYRCGTCVPSYLINNRVIFRFKGFACKYFNLLVYYPLAKLALQWKGEKICVYTIKFIFKAL